MLYCMLYTSYVETVRLSTFSELLRFSVLLHTVYTVPGKGNYSEFCVSVRRKGLGREKGLVCVGCSSWSGSRRAPLLPQGPGSRTAAPSTRAPQPRALPFQPKRTARARHEPGEVRADRRGSDGAFARDCRLGLPCRQRQNRLRRDPQGSVASAT